jgi:hypothetical protein
MKLKRFGFALLLTGALLIGLVGGAAAAPSENACWGQATKAYVDTEVGIMGEHASSYSTPRVGLRNLARSLHELGVLEDDSMQALGAFVAAEEGLEVDACATE